MAQQFAGSSWQRCRVHFMRNIRAAVATMWLLPEVHRGSCGIEESVVVVEPLQMPCRSVRV
ncbi:transposase [Rhodococcus ruber]|uniref:transposase n=1 Tax=Rhodococcus ruber TaxID=1830 RepID=UPI003438FD43